jgi:phosphatidylglycerophosphate synthase
MRNCSLKTKIISVMSIAVLVFLTYIFCRVRMASGIPVVHPVWSGELASLLRTLAKSVQLLGMLAAGSTLIAAAKNWKAKQPNVYVQVLQGLTLCVMSFVTPDLAAHCIPVLFGVMLDF